MARQLCPICRQPFDTDASVAMPFCSDRCRMVDLRRWLNEEYCLPVNPEAEATEDADAPPAGGD